MRLVLLQPDPVPAAQSFATARALVHEPLGEQDLVLLPEHIAPTGPFEPYLAGLRSLAADLGCHVVGGSFHQVEPTRKVNAGAVVAPDGTVVAHYEKVRPYAAERAHVEPGHALGRFELGGRRFSVLICADFWFMDLLLGAPEAPDVVLVPAFSVTRKPTPDYSRRLWHHLAIARAYELGVFVAVSDWAHDPASPFRTSGVAGFADPTTTDPDQLWEPVPASGHLRRDLDFAALDAFRADRRARGFFWQLAGEAGEAG
ncbi:MAG: carbon-nitrogen hydrolase family protein [Polyangiaceae bacterium]